MLLLGAATETANSVIIALLAVVAAVMVGFVILLVAAFVDEVVDLDQYIDDDE